MGNLLLSSGSNSMATTFIMIAMLIGVYALIFIPQKRQQKKDVQMRSSLDIGDEVMTTGGIIGRVVSIKEDTVLIETGNDRVKLRFIKNAVAQNITAAENAAARKAAAIESKKKD